jgi:hypothetical protein
MCRVVLSLLLVLLLSLFVFGRSPIRAGVSLLEVIIFVVWDIELEAPVASAHARQQQATK